MRFAANCVALTTVAVGLAAAPAAADMKLHFIDVGQGDATLVEFPCAAMLVDAGAEQNLDYDGTAALIAYLDAFFAARPELDRTLALLAVTHPHVDHTRALPQVAQRYTVANVLTNGQRSGSGGREQHGLQQRARASRSAWKRNRLGLAAEIGYQAVTLGDGFPLSGLSDPVIDPIACPAVDPVIRVLWGEIQTSNHGLGGSEVRNLNNHSLVLRIDYGQGSALFTGDLEEEAIELLVERYAGTHRLDVDVYQVGHHGSGNGTTAGLMAAMSPKLAVISMGPPCRQGMDWTGGTWVGRSYGHPRQRAIDQLEAGVTLSGRDDPTVPVATGTYTFAPRTLSKKIYGTGWDGTVVVKVQADGWVDVVETTGQPACPSSP
ncbi:MAG: MBL fold metallo-hydrolase [Proteobacteria bacterium]|nr:MBL fold metallo-hydrolase [Pseudomonadota bacterium]